MRKVFLTIRSRRNTNLTMVYLLYIFFLNLSPTTLTHLHHPSLSFIPPSLPLQSLSHAFSSHGIQSLPFQLLVHPSMVVFQQASSPAPASVPMVVAVSNLSPAPAPVSKVVTVSDLSPAPTLVPTVVAVLD